MSVGVLNNQQLQELIDGNVIKAPLNDPVRDSQIQPASMDLRLGGKAYRVLSSFLPERTSVEDKLHAPDMYGSDLIMYDIDITDGAVLEKNQVYLIPLMESLALPNNIRGRANPKSTTGRLDIFTRVITDYNNRFDDIESGYKGQLYLEVMPRSFAVKVRAGQTLVQLRLVSGKGDYMLTRTELKRLYEDEKLLYDGDSAVPFNEASRATTNGLYMSVDLSGDNPSGIIGYKNKKNSHYVDMDKIDYYNVDEFWEPIYKHTIKDTLILEPEEFYILASKERIRVPLEYAAEMVPYEVGSGELRTHYAGFFDPGFGYGKKGELTGTKAVLEVRARDVPFMIADGQTFFTITFEKMAETPDRVYGVDIGSSYQGQGIKLSKHFKDG